MKTTHRATFGGRLSAVLVTAGSAVGLGNIWRFPYVAGENGGGAFLLIYILSVLLLGVPIMLSEFAIGRNTHRNAVGAYRIYGGPVITIDFGTTTTFGVVDDHANFLGGAICPGVQVSLGALIEKRGIYAARMKILSAYATSLKAQERSAESGAAEKMATEKTLKSR